MRIVAALLVVIQHCREIQLPRKAYLNNPEWWLQLSYLPTALGQQAVVMFFVLSGFLVGGPALRRFRLEQFRWRSYAIDRGVRLWIVLIPTLFLTFFCDQLGAALGGTSFYAGELQDRIPSGPGPTPVDHSLTAALGNALFLNGFYVPHYGSNRPLWSLAFEFWFYLFFPLLLTAWYRRGFQQLLSMVGACVTVLLFGPQFLANFSLWGCGVVAALFVEQAPAPKSKLQVVCATFVLLAVAIGTRIAGAYAGFYGNLMFATVVAGWIVIVLPSISISAVPAQWLKRSAGFSFSMYAIHYPVLVLAAIAFFNLKLMRPDVAGWTSVLILSTIATLVAWLFSKFTEERTGTLRQWMHRIFKA